MNVDLSRQVTPSSSTTPDSELARATRLAAIGKLSAQVAHELIAAANRPQGGAGFVVRPPMNEAPAGR